DGRDHGVFKTPAEEPVDGRTNERQHGDDPKIEVLVHSFSRFTWSTFRVSRVRKTEIIIARPTAASAAATTITKKTKTWPLSATTSAPLASLCGEEFQ